MLEARVPTIIKKTFTAIDCCAFSRDRDFLNEENPPLPNLFLTLSIKWRVKLTKESLKSYRSQWAIVKYPLAFRNKQAGTRSYSFLSLFFYPGIE